MCRPRNRGIFSLKICFCHQLNAPGIQLKSHRQYEQRYHTMWWDNTTTVCHSLMSKFQVHTKALLYQSHIITSQNCLYLSTGFILLSVRLGQVFLWSQSAPRLKFNVHQQQQNSLQFYSPEKTLKHTTLIITILRCRLSIYLVIIINTLLGAIIQVSTFLSTLWPFTYFLYFRILWDKFSTWEIPSSPGSSSVHIARLQFHFIFLTS